MENNDTVEYSNPFTRLLDTIIAPEDAFGSLRKKPGWFLTTVICLLIALGASVFILEMTIDFSREQTVRYAEEHRLELTAEQYEAILAQAERMGESPIFYVFFFGMPLVQMLLYVLLAAAALNIGAGVAGKKLGFKNGLGIVSLGLVTYAAGTIVSVILFRLTGDFNAGTNLGVLFPAQPQEWYLRLGKYLASTIDLFALWAVYLYTVGLSELTGLSRKKSFRVVLVLFILWALLSVGLGFLFTGSV